MRAIARGFALALTLLACVPAHAKGHQTAPADSASAKVQADADRIASALETANAYAQAPEQRQDAKRALTAAESAARWARVMAIVAAIDTLITAAGDGLSKGVGPRASQRRPRDW
jgi:hypothetical protein